MQLENAEHKTHFSEGLGSSVFEKVNIPRKYVKNPTKWDLSKNNLNFDPNLDRSNTHDNTTHNIRGSNILTKSTEVLSAEWAEAGGGRGVGGIWQGEVPRSY